MEDTVGSAKLAASWDGSAVETGVAKTKKTVATLGDAAKDAGKQASDGIKKIGDATGDAAKKAERATRQIQASLQRAIAAAEAGGRGTAKSFAALANLRGADVGALRPLLDQLDALEKKQKAAEAASKSVAPAIATVGLTARQTAAALRSVPAQFTDIVTQLAAGQAPLQVFIQQGGQLKDLFGGIGPAAQALGGYLLGLVNPLTIAAAAVAALGLAYFQGSKEADNFARSIIFSGNAAGLTVSDLQEMAERIGAVTGSQHAAAEALAQFVANGTLAGDSIERFTTIAIKMEKVTGQAVAETVKQFAALGKDPVEASAKLNEQTNFLTASVARQIKILENQGRATDAARLAQETFAASLESRFPQMEQRLGLIERSWNAITGAIKRATNALLDIGRPDTTQQSIDKLQKELAIREQRGPLNPLAAGAFERGNADLRARIALLQEQQKFDRLAAQGRARESEQAKARLTFDRAGDEFLSKRARMEKEITIARQQGAAAGATQAEIDQRIADIRKKFEDKGATRAAAGAARRLDRADLGLDIEQIRGEAEKLVGIYSSAERRIDAVRAAGLLSDSEFFEAKREFIRLESAAKEDQLKKEIARFQQEKLTGADKLQNDRKIADAEAKLAILRADTSSKLEALSDQQVQATRREAAEFLGARQAAEDYINAIGRRQEQDLAGIGRGNRARALDRSITDIRERFRTERDRLTNLRAQQEITGTFTEDERRRFDNRLALINEFEERELAQFQEFDRRKLASEKDWLNGAQEALRNYSDQAGNVAGTVEDAFSRTFQSLEDAIAQFVATGKLSFSSLVRSILADMARIQARQLTGALAKSLAGAIGAAFGGGVNLGSATGADLDVFTSGLSVVGGRAIGGPVHAGGLYRVNERAPELLNVGREQFLMMNGGNGSVQPAGDGGVTIVNNGVPVKMADRRRMPSGREVITLTQSEEFIASRLSDPNSPMSKAMQRHYTVSRNR